MNKQIENRLNVLLGYIGKKEKVKLWIYRIVLCLSVVVKTLIVGFAIFSFALVCYILSTIVYTDSLYVREIFYGVLFLSGVIIILYLPAYFRNALNKAKWAQQLSETTVENKLKSKIGFFALFIVVLILIFAVTFILIA